MIRFSRSCVIGAALVGLTGCNTVSVQYVDATGRHGSGEATVSVTQQNGTFSITDKGATCSGTFANWNQLTVVFPVTCTDGKSGSVTMTRPTEGPIIGEGTMELRSGEKRRFLFGREGGLAKWRVHNLV